MAQQIFVSDEELAVVMAMREHKAVTPHQQAYDLLRHSAMFVNWSIKSGLIIVLKRITCGYSGFEFIIWRTTAV